MSDVVIEVEVKSNEATKDLNKINKAFDGIEKQASKSGRVSDRSLASIAKFAVPAAAAVASVGVAFASFVEDARAIEDLQTQFIAFTGSAESAADQVERISQFAAATPFGLQDLAEANRTLLAFGSSTEESLKQLKQLGEAAAATGNNVGELAVIFGQIQAAGKLSSERFNQLVERGINIGPALAESLGVAESSLADLRSQGKITSEDVAKAFALMTEEGGQFAGSLERQSKTLSGSISTLKDNIFLLSANIGKQLSPALITVANLATEAAQEFNKWLSSGNAAEIARIDEQIEQLNTQLEETKKQANETNKSFKGLSSGGFLGTTVKEINNAANQVDGSIESITNKIDELQKKREELSQPTASADQGEASNAVLEQTKKNNEEVKAEDKKAASEKTARAKQLNAELAAIETQRIETERALAEARKQEDSDILATQLDQQREFLVAKEQEKNNELLAEQQRYQDLAETLAQQEINRAQKARDDEFNLRKQKAKAELAFETATWAQRAATTSQGLSTIAALQSTGNKTAFEIGKAAAAAQVLVDTPLAAMKAYTSLIGIPGVGPILAPAAAAAAVAVGAANLQRINSQTFTGFSEGGLVTGGIPGVDSVPAMLTPGEVVVPEKNFDDIGMDNSEQVALLTDIKNILTSQQETETDTREDVIQTESTPLTVNLTLNEEVLASQMLEISRDNLRTA